MFSIIIVGDTEGHPFSFVCHGFPSQESASLFCAVMKRDFEYLCSCHVNFSSIIMEGNKDA